MKEESKCQIEKNYYAYERELNPDFLEYRYKNMMYVIDEKNGFYSELLFEEPNLGMFSKKSWKHPASQAGRAALRLHNQLAGAHKGNADV